MILQPLKETNIRRLLTLGKQYGFMLISASRQPLSSDRLAKIKQAEINNDNNDNLAKDILEKGLSYIPVYGGYKEDGQAEATEEKSFFVLNIIRKTRETLDVDDFFQFAFDLCGKYDQDSVLLYSPSEDDDPSNTLKFKNINYFTREGKKSNIPLGDNLIFDDILEKYFTRLTGTGDHTYKHASLDKVNRQLSFLNDEDLANKKVKQVNMSEMTISLPFYDTLTGRFLAESLAGEILLRTDDSTGAYLEK